MSSVGFAAVVGSHLHNAGVDTVELDDEADDPDVHACTEVDVNGPLFEDVVTVLYGAVCDTGSFTFDELLPVYTLTLFVAFSRDFKGDCIKC